MSGFQIQLLSRLTAVSGVIICIGFTITARTLSVSLPWYFVFVGLFGQSLLTASAWLSYFSYCLQRKENRRDRSLLVPMLVSGIAVAITSYYWLDTLFRILSQFLSL